MKEFIVLIVIVVGFALSIAAPIAVSAIPP